MRVIFFRYAHLLVMAVAFISTLINLTTNKIIKTFSLKQQSCESMHRSIVISAVCGLYFIALAMSVFSQKLVYSFPGGRQHPSEMTLLRPYLFGVNTKSLPCDSAMRVLGVIKTSSQKSYLLGKANHSSMFIKGEYWLDRFPVVEANDSQITVNAAGQWKRYCFHTAEQSDVELSTTPPQPPKIITTPYLSLAAGYSDLDRRWYYRITNCFKRCSMMNAIGISVHDRVLMINNRDLNPEILSSILEGKGGSIKDIDTITLEHKGVIKAIQIPDYLKKALG